ncbi:MAG TPA: sigma-70 family RNA polymerase sigma factor [Stellaceae bacterium]|nr:sigma-70 family RNA polymerase sigma factor [Stellaceae bacterium]
MKAEKFGKLLEEQIPRLRRYARSLARDVIRADDLVQDCLCRAIQKCDLFHPDTNLRAWLFTILHNQHINNLRKTARERASASVEDVTQVLATRPNQLAWLEIRDVDRAFAALSQEQRQVLRLVALEGLPYGEAANILDLPVGTVRSRLSRAREVLRERLKWEQPRAAA